MDAIAHMVGQLIARLTITEVTTLIVLMDESPNTLHDALCQRFKDTYPQAALELFGDSEEV